MLKKNITAKFLALFVPGFLILTSIFIYVSTQKQISDARNQLSVRVGTQISRVSNLISLDIIKTNPKIAYKIMSILMSDEAITCVDTTVSGIIVPNIAQPYNFGCQKLHPEKSVQIDVSDSQEIKMVVGFSENEIANLKKSSVLLGIYTILAGLASAIIFSLVAFRITVGKPVSNLLTAITSSKKDELYFVPEYGEDEIGNLCTEFNSMQTRLRKEEIEIKDTLDNLSNVYNSTPALLFTMNGEGLVKSASEYWMATSGYSTDEVIGHSLESLMCPDSRNRLKFSVLDDLKIVGSVRDVPIRFWYKDGSEIDVLLSIVPDRRKSELNDSFVCIMNDITLLRHAEKNLHAIAVTDQLTQLPNRYAVNEHFEKLSQHDELSSKGWAMLFLDLDNFKTINDSFGHEAGDEILRVTANRIKGTVNENDMIARIGGDEFVVVLHELNGIECAKTTAKKLIDTLSKPVKLKNGYGTVGTSIGITYCDDGSIEPTEALRFSDQAMYLAKCNGKNQYALYEERQAAGVRTRADQVQLIQNGLENRWFEIYFQPIIDLYTQRPFAFEALLRVKKGGVTVKSIEGLIQIAEESGQMEELGEWIFEESISRFRNFTDSDNGNKISISINLSPIQLTENFVRKVKQQLQKYPDMANRLIFEITETAALGRFDAVCYLLQDLRDLGVRIAIDDFGTGYSSLSYICRLPIDILKLDKSFIEKTDCSSIFQSKPGAQQALLRSVAALAIDLELEIVAEGIETADLVKEYLCLGVRYGQGYLFAKPMSAIDANVWLDSIVEDNIMVDWEDYQHCLAS